LKGGSKADYLTDRLEDEAERFIEANQDRPFFLYLPNFAVHIPLQAKREMIEHYQAKSKPDAPHNHPVYAAMVQSMDEAVGRLTRKLDQLNIADRTVIFFTADNGGVRFAGKMNNPGPSKAPPRG